MGVGNFWTLLHGRRNRITTGTRNKVTALFVQHWDKPQDGPRAERAKKIAKHYRWVGPLAWDDIDDIAFLLELGESPHQAAVIVGRTVPAIVKAAERHHRSDIQTVFERTLRKRVAA